MSWPEYAQAVAAVTAVVTPLVIIIHKLSRLCERVDRFTGTVERLDEKLERHLDWHLDYSNQVPFKQQHMRKT